MTETVAVFGGAGYLGTTLTRQLVEKGYNVRIVDNLLYGQKVPIYSTINGNVSFVKAL